MTAHSNHEVAALDLWRAAEADYQNEARHRAFIAYCAQTGILPFAAARYAQREKVYPGDPVVARCREILLAQAVAGMGAPQPPGGIVGFVRRHRTTIAALSAAVILALLFLVLRGLQSIPAQLERMFR